MSTSSTSASPRTWARRWTHRATASLLRPGRVLPVMIPILIRLATVTDDLQSQKPTPQTATPSDLRQGRVVQASLAAQRSLLLCRANEVGLAELVDVDNAVFGTYELFVVELPGRLKNVRPRRQFLRGAVVAFDCVDPGPLHQYRVVVRRVSVHARLEPAAWLLQQHAER